MDPRARAAQYYDANPVSPNDVPFYRQRIPSPRAKVLELGCGTGRVLVSLLDRCGYIHGIDHSEEMLALCLKGSYQGETYGDGPELVARFAVGNREGPD